MIIENTKENQHVPSAVKNKHTCGHGLVGRDAAGVLSEKPAPRAAFRKYSECNDHL